jgi:hypothetical protein
MQGAEERRLRRMEQYAARRSDESNAADDALMVYQGKVKKLDREGKMFI